MAVGVEVGVPVTVGVAVGLGVAVLDFTVGLADVKSDSIIGSIEIVGEGEGLTTSLFP